MSKKPEQQPTFEALLQELETLVKRFEQGQLPLDEAITAYERGMFLQKQCAEKLHHAKSKIEMVTKGEKEAPLALEPLETGMLPESESP